MKKKLLIITLNFVIMLISFIPVYAKNDQTVTKVYTIYIDDLYSTRDSTTYNRTSGEIRFSDKKNNITMNCSALLTVTIRENMATGVITSYNEPVLNVYNCYASGYEVFSENLSTSCSLSSTKRTLKCTGTFNIYARSGTGVRMATSKKFKIEFNAS